MVFVVVPAKLDSFSGVFMICGAVAFLMAFITAETKPEPVFGDGVLSFDIFLFF